MKAALERMADAYAKGVIDPTTLTNGTSDCRNKFYSDEFGVFTYWAGTWATNLKTNLESNDLDGELVALPPIAEVGTYLDRIPPVWCITQLFNENCRTADLVPSTDEMSQYNGDLTTLKNQLIASVVMGEMTIEDAYAKYEADGGAGWSQTIVDSLNTQ